MKKAWAPILIGLWIAFSQPAWAQGCAMCRSSLAQAESIAASINLGILILLFPPLLIMSAILFAAFRQKS